MVGAWTPCSFTDSPWTINKKLHVTTELFLSRLPGGDAGRRGKGAWGCGGTAVGGNYTAGMCNLTLLEQMGVSWPWTIHFWLLWVLVWVFSFLYYHCCLGASWNNLEGIQNLFLKACLCSGTKNRHMQSRKRKDKLNSFSGSGSNFGVLHYLHAQTYVWNT